MRNLTIDKYSFEVPSTWNELTYNQLRVVFMASYINASEEYVKLQLLRECTGVTRLDEKRIVRELMYLYPFRYKYHRIWLAAVDIAHATSAFNFLFDEKNRFVPGLTVQPMPSIKFKKTTLYGPGNSFENLIVAEWIGAETLMAKYAETANTEFLFRVLATLWRPLGKDKKRIALTDDSEEYYTVFEKIEPWKLQAMVHWYDSCSIAIANHFPSIFPKKETNIQKPNRIIASDVFKSFMNIVEILADNDVTKKPIVRVQYLYDALFTWQSLIEQNEELQKMSSK